MILFMGIGIVVFFILIALSYGIADVHASTSDEIKYQNIIFTEKQNELKHQKEVLEKLKLNSGQSWDALKEIPDAEFEVEYAINQLKDARSTLHQLYQDRSNQIKELRLTDEAKAFGVTSKEDARLSEEFQDSLTDIFQIGKQLSRLVARTLVPVFEDAGNAITEWFKANKDLIEQNIPKFVDGIALAFKLLTIAAAGFLSLKILGFTGIGPR